MKRIFLLICLTLTVSGIYSQNLVQNNGFESGSVNWNVQWNAAVVNSNARTGIAAVRVGNGISQGTAEQTITGLSANTTYTLKAFGKVDAGVTVAIGAKNFGGTETFTTISSSSYTEGSLTFTTGSSSTSAIIFFYKNNNASGYAYGDDFQLTPLSAGGNTSPGNTTYYVDSQGGVDSNDGKSPATAWATLSKVNGFTFAAGDIIKFHADGAWTGTLYPKGSGVSGNPIVITKYGTTDFSNRPVIDGNAAIRAVYLYNQQYWEISNLEVINSANAGTKRRGIEVENVNSGQLNYIRIKNNNVHDVNGDNTKDTDGSHGILVVGRITGTNDIPSWFNDVLIEGNEVRNVKRTGIGTSSPWSCRQSIACTSGNAYKSFTNVVIRNNYIENAGGDGIIPINSSGTIIENNIVNGSNVNSGTYNAGIWTWNSDNVIIQNNESYNCKTTLDGQGYDIDYGQTGTIIQYNYSHDNEGGFLLFAGLAGGTCADGIVRYNVSQNDKARVFHFTGIVTNMKVYNNTIYLAAGSNVQPIRSENNGTKTAVFNNNIFYLQGSGDWYGLNSNMTFGYNLFYPNHYTNEPSDANKITSNPRLIAPGTGTFGSGFDSNHQIVRGNVDGYKLETGSPALNTGLLVANNGGLDYWGTAVSSTLVPNIGAYNGTGETPIPSTNLIANPSFESGTSPWNIWGGASLVQSNAYVGSFAVKATAGNGAEQTITGLSPNTTYTLSGWMKVDNASESIILGVKNLSFSSTSGTSYTKVSYTFTTGSSQTSIVIFVYKNAGTGNGYGDNLNLVVGNSSARLLSKDTKVTPFSEMSVYPNPAKSNIYLNYLSDDKQKGVLNILDFSGNVVMKHAFNLVKGNNTLEFPVEGLKKGLYIFSYELDSESFVKKIAIDN